MYIVLILFFKKSQQFVALKFLVLLQVTGCSLHIKRNMAEIAMRMNERLTFACAQVSAV